MVDVWQRFLPAARCAEEGTNLVGASLVYVRLLAYSWHMPPACPTNFATTHGFKLDGTFQEYAVRNPSKYSGCKRLKLDSQI